MPKNLSAPRIQNAVSRASQLLAEASLRLKMQYRKVADGPICGWCDAPADTQTTMPRHAGEGVAAKEAK